MKNVNVIGLMSGTSLDGLDVCYARFENVNNQWSASQLVTHAFDYDSSFIEKLKKVFNMSGDDLKKADEDFGVYQAKKVLEFIDLYDLTGKVDFIAAHGHTIFHKPNEGYTLQIGNGQIIANQTNLPVINDFRSLDVSLGGQGAPLVPIGDEMLFGAYDACLNLGGFSNISYDDNGIRRAFDISPCNLPLNAIMHEHYGLTYDEDGSYAREGIVIDELLIELNSLAYYEMKAPKSLGIEWLTSVFNEKLDKFKGCNPKDVLATIIEHETDQIGIVLDEFKIKSVLITGGGTFNKFFIERLSNKILAKIEIPSHEIIGFKEALVFGFLGVLKWNNQINTYKTVTGAIKDSSGGVLHFPKVNN